MKPRLTASLVIFNCDVESFLPALTSFLNGFDGGIIVISDNSDIPLSDKVLDHPRIEYIFNGENLGFGTAHNRAVHHLGKRSDLHLILNPDICFDETVIVSLVNVLLCDSSIGVVMPKIVYPDGSLQRLCKLLPSPIDLLLRRFIPFSSVQNIINRRYEMYDLPQDDLVEVPTVSGCFLLFRMDLFHKLGGFDERYFMYLEDVDLVRGIGNYARVVYYPRVSVTHTYAKGSYHNRRLFFYHVTSAIRYFTKWGWFWDSIRTERNRRALDSIGSKL
jgi:GT2 family glycosyltransferase